MPTYAQYPPYLGDPNVPFSDFIGFETPVPVTGGDFAGNPLDWDKTMYEFELDQQWNCVSPTTMTSV
jgi:hypothetical protein